MVWKMWCKALDRYPIPTLIVLFGAVLIYEGLTKGAWIITTIIFVETFVISLAVAAAAKLIFKVERGGKAERIMDYRRPSAHTLVATTLSTVAGCLDWILIIPLGLFVFFTVLERYYTGAHKLNEILEGFAIGLILGFALYYLLV